VKKPSAKKSLPIKGEPELTPRQRRFVAEYLLDLNATAAARRAGYSAKNADKIGPALLGKTRVAAAIQTAKQARSARTELSADYVVRRLMAEAELQGPGASHAARVRSLELLGKHVGMFPDRHEHRHGGDPANPAPIPHQHHNERELSDEERERRIREILARANARAAAPHDDGGAS
jgi:hypothetical protein